MKTLVTLLMVALVMMIGSAVFATEATCPTPTPTPICQRTDTAPVKLIMPKNFNIAFEDDLPFVLNLECGDTSAKATKKFYAGHNCKAKVTGQLVPPPTAPAGLVWAWKFVGDSQQLIFTGCGIETGTVEVSVSGVQPCSPCGEYAGGTMTITIDAI